MLKRSSNDAIYLEIAGDTLARMARDDKALYAHVDMVGRVWSVYWALDEGPEHSRRLAGPRNWRNKRNGGLFTPLQHGEIYSLTVLAWLLGYR